MDFRTFSKHVKYIKISLSTAANSQLEVVQQEVREAHLELISVKPAPEVVDIAVSFNATWHKKGHTSNYSVGCVVDVLTGYITDYEVLSKHCHACMVSGDEMGINSIEFDVWHEGHKLECQKNYVGSSGGMEVELAKVLWSRSTKIGFRYLDVVSDGYSKRFISLQDMNIYETDVQLIKEECVNHVGKRMGTSQLKFVDTEKKKGVMLDGRKHGSLKDSTIKSITRYYQNAIIRNKENVDQMKTNITHYYFIANPLTNTHIIRNVLSTKSLGIFITEPLIEMKYLSRKLKQ